MDNHFPRTETRKQRLKRQRRERKWAQAFFLECELDWIAAQSKEERIEVLRQLGGEITSRLINFATRLVIKKFVAKASSDPRFLRGIKSPMVARAQVRAMRSEAVQHPSLTRPERDTVTRRTIFP